MNKLPTAVRRNRALLYVEVQVSLRAHRRSLAEESTSRPPRVTCNINIDIDVSNVLKWIILLIVTLVLSDSPRFSRPRSPLAPNHSYPAQIQLDNGKNQTTLLEKRKTRLSPNWQSEEIGPSYGGGPHRASTNKDTTATRCNTRSLSPGTSRK